MARPVFATIILPLILVRFLLFQVCHCSSSRALLNPEPEVQQQQALVPTAPAAAHHRDEPPYHRDAAAAKQAAGARAVAAAIVEDDGQQSSVRADGAGAAPSSMATTASSPRDTNQQGGGGVASSWPNRSALLARPEPHQVLLLRSKLARRFLVTGVVEGADSAARASCHSSDVHNSGCTPPSEH